LAASTVVPHPTKAAAKYLGKAVQIIKKHFIGQAFIAFHGTDASDIRNPTSNQLIDRVTMGDTAEPIAQGSS